MNKTLTKKQQGMKIDKIKILANGEKFEIKELIENQGGSSKVHKASWLSNNGQLVAYKVIREDKIHWEKEVNALEKINKTHPQAAIKLETHSFDDNVLVLEFAESSLDKEIEERAKVKNIQFDIHEVYTIICSITKKIKDIHSSGVKQHRDIKPHNILLLKKNDFNSIRISDFGTSQVKDVGTVHPHYLPITYAYAPPETLKGESEPDDIFSLGMILYELLEGTDVIPKQNQDNERFRQVCIENGENVSKEIKNKIKKRNYNRDISSLDDKDKYLFINLLNIASKALHFDRNERYSDVKGLYDDIKKAKLEQTVSGTSDVKQSLHKTEESEQIEPGTSSFKLKYILNTVFNRDVEYYLNLRFPIYIIISIIMYPFLLNVFFTMWWGAHLPIFSPNFECLSVWFHLIAWNINICNANYVYWIVILAVFTIHKIACKFEQKCLKYKRKPLYLFVLLILNLIFAFCLLFIMSNTPKSNGGPKLSTDDGKYYQRLILNNISDLSQKDMKQKLLSNANKSFILALPTEHDNCFNEYQVAARILDNAGYHMPDIKQMTQSDLSRAINSVTRDGHLQKNIRKLLIPDIINDWGMTFTYIPPVENIIAGSPKNETDRSQDETLRSISFKQGFYFQTTEITQKQWLQLMKTRPWLRDKTIKENDDLPAVNVSWNDCDEFIKKINNNDPDIHYRLPDENEWEYACRANSKTRFHWGDAPTRENANMDFRQLKRDSQYSNPGNLMKVKTFKPNAFGLFDMHGNAWEWCNNKNTDTNKYATKGGSWRSEPSYCRCANRGWLFSDFVTKDQGFRLIIVEKKFHMKRNYWRQYP